MTNKTSRKALQTAVILLLGALVVAVLAVLAYVCIVGESSGYALANDNATWANFGTYIGGVLGPIFAYLAFMGVLITAWLQAKHLEEFQKQAELQETQRMLSVVSERIDLILYSEPRRKVDHPRIQESKATIFTLLSAAGTLALTKGPDTVMIASGDGLLTKLKESISADAPSLGIELNQLSWLLQQFEDQSGSQVVAGYYKNRYLAVVCWLDVIGFLSAHPATQQYFNPKEARQFLTPEQRQERNPTTR